MTTEANISRSAFWIISIVAICLAGFMTHSNLNEFYLIEILGQTDGYPFGGEGPTPYYYKTPGLYSTVNLIWGLLFFTALVFSIKTTMKRQRENVIYALGLILLVLFIHGLIS